jgi:hypothetical protein
MLQVVDFWGLGSRRSNWAAAGGLQKGRGVTLAGCVDVEYAGFCVLKKSCL